MRRRPAAESKTKGGRELWKWRGCGKGGKPKAGFPLFPRTPWKSRQAQARFPHFHNSGECWLSQSEEQAKQRIEKCGPWKSGNPRAGFPLSHRPESPRQQGNRHPMENASGRFRQHQSGTYLKRLAAALRATCRVQE